MKKTLLWSLALLGALTSNAQSRVDSEGNEVYHHLFFTAQYQIGDFDFAKETGAYGLGMVYSSLSHWGIFHVGANLNISLNAGLVDPWGMIIDFGPSARIDISKNFFINIPVNAMCSVDFPEEKSDPETDWAAKISPAIHAFFTDKFGIFAGPQITIGEGDPSFGMTAGLSYTF